MSVGRASRETGRRRCQWHNLVHGCVLEPQPLGRLAEQLSQELARLDGGVDGFKKVG
jgi:hypothetical protein